MLYWIILKMPDRAWKPARNVWAMECGPFIDYESANDHRTSKVSFDGCGGHDGFGAGIIALEHEEGY